MRKQLYIQVDVSMIRNSTGNLTSYIQYRFAKEPLRHLEDCRLHGRAAAILPRSYPFGAGTVAIHPAGIPEFGASLVGLQAAARKIYVRSSLPNRSLNAETP